MSNENIEYLIEIDTLTTLTDSTIGLADGVIQWTPYGYNGLDATQGRLSQRWITSIKSGARVSQGGQLAYTGVAKISLLPTSGVYEAFQLYNLQNGNLPVTIKIRDSGTEKVVHRGVVGTITPTNDATIITVEDVTRNRKSDSVYPYYLGEDNLIQLSATTKRVELPNIPSLDLPVILATTPLPAYNTYIYAQLENFLQGSLNEAWVDEANALLDGGFVSINGLACKSFEWNLGGVVTAEYIDGNLATANIIAGQPLDAYIDNTVYEFDEYANSGGFDTSNIYDSNGNAIEGYIDAIEFGTNTLIVSDVDGSYFKRADQLNPWYVGEEYSGIKDDLGISPTFEHFGDGWWASSAITSGITTSFTDLDNTIDANYTTYSDAVIESSDSNMGVCHHVMRFNTVSSTEPQRALFNCKIDLNILDVEYPNVDYSFNVKVFAYANWATNKMSEALVIGDDDTPTPLPTVPIEMADIHYANLLNSPTAENFRFEGEGLTKRNYTDTYCGVAFEFGDRIPKEWWKGGFQVVVMTTQESLLAGSLQEVGLRYHDVSLIKELPFSASDFYVKWDGRKIDSSVVSYTGQAYELATRLQNLSDTGTEPPTGGWGSEEPTVADWTTLINRGIDYGGVNSVQYAIQGKVDTAETLKSDMAVAMVALGCVNDDGKESLYYLPDGLYNTDGVLIEHGDLIKGIEPQKTPIDQSEIYNEYNINGVQVSNVEAENKPADQDTPMWEMGNALYSAYKVKNMYKGKDSLVTTADTPKFITSMMMWYGVNDELENYPAEPNNWVVYERFTLKLTLPLYYIFTNALYVGAKVRYNDIWEGEYSGIVIDRTYDLNNSTVTITASCTSNKILSGGDKLVYVESGTATDQIEETGTQTDQIEEG